MRSILSGARGMSPVVLVILIAWALLSVIFLTGTLLAARSIDRSVSGVTNRTDASGKPEKNIATTVDEIGSDAKFIDQARKTVQISTAIRKAADPLSGEMGKTLDVAKKGIDPKLKSILGKVGTINASADSINGTVKTIGGTVDSILAAVLEINDSATSINGHVKHIGALGLNIRTSASQINGSARSILGRLSSVLTAAKSIDPKVDTIIGQATGIKAVTAPILSDFDGILSNVGTENGTKTVVGHANGVDCSTLINGTGCNK